MERLCWGPRRLGAPEHEQDPPQKRQQLLADVGWLLRANHWRSHHDSNAVAFDCGRRFHRLPLDRGVLLRPDRPEGPVPPRPGKTGDRHYCYGIRDGGAVPARLTNRRLGWSTSGLGHLHRHISLPTPLRSLLSECPRVFARSGKGARRLISSGQAHFIGRPLACLMETFTWSKPSTDHPEKSKVAVLLPGSGYPVEGPVLFWIGEMLGSLGWHVQAVRWTPDDAPTTDPHKFAATAAKNAFAASPDAEQRLVVAKSFSTFCIPWAEETLIPGIWLTPLLTDERVRSTIGATSKDDLFVGGSQDKLWDGGRKSESAGTFFEVPGADHSLQIPEDWRASQQAQADVFERIEKFISELGA
ncbi:hypothetical protein ARUE_c36110 [Arthrobacter sp. Rue61a]|nr:hypothetical protein ARUE_c36110 [Arthrobacter sp. Rue61a]